MEPLADLKTVGDTSLMQKEEIIVTDREQAKALVDVGFLNQFLYPTSPSDAAKRLGISANLAHHHAKRHSTLGLLIEAKREGGRVYYELAARTFKHERTLVPFGSSDERVAATLSLLQERFMAEYERSSASVTSDEDWTVYGFADSPGRENRPQEVAHVSPVERAAHLQLRSFRLSPSRYQELITRLRNLLEDFVAEPGQRGCTVAILAMDGHFKPGLDDSRMISSFVAPTDLD